ncbi:MAG TPA: bifunctional UDP-N-acetylglucosamine diphosphorylase/glucosamine-1-phosphate N-acetyltransferase GlmU [Gaiellaceae bacterium]|nr:bifunctional UDP-N-acetylglucosamine diphosphorylase/glucosamine-1-phosphate N-acetyltransferase GlmU [Gaiellaceae bacterium]
MTDTTLAAVVMAGGLGTRMRSATPKHLHPILGRRMVDWVVEAAQPLELRKLVVVASPDTRESFDGHEVAVQERPLGTGDAVRAARGALDGAASDILVLSGDTPLLTSALLESLVAAHRDVGAAATVLTFEPADARAYGRVVRGEDGGIRRIVEAADASDDELALRECNTSIYVFRAELLWPALERLEPRNAQGELYLTDAVRDLVEAGERVGAHLAPDPAETEGVNTRVELAAATSALRDRVNRGHMLAGVTISDPASTWIDPTVALEPDVVVHPFTVLRGATTVRAGAEVGPHVVAVDAEIGAGALVGPFCYLRPGTVLHTKAKAGTFVEIKNSRIGARTKVPHLSYIGDADIGEDTNIAASNVTVNFAHQPGRGKGRTTIGRNVRTGVDNAFVAPVTIGDDAWIAAGSVITADVPPNALAIARSRQENKEGRGGKRDD